MRFVGFFFWQGGVYFGSKVRSSAGRLQIPDSAHGHVVLTDCFNRITPFLNWGRAGSGGSGAPFSLSGSYYFFAASMACLRQSAQRLRNAGLSLRIDFIHSAPFMSAPHALQNPPSVD